MKRKSWVLLFTVLLLLALASTVQAAETKKFTDLSATDPSLPYVQYLAGKGIINGYPDGTYQPNSGLTRAEAAVVICKTAGLSVDKPTGAAFRDVPPAHWAQAYIAAAAKAGYVKGNPDNTYRPEQKLTRAEGIVLIFRLSKSDISQASLPLLSDINNKHWAAQPVAAALAVGMVGLTEDKKSFLPDAPFTRISLAQALGVLLTEDPSLYRITLPGTLKPITGKITLKKVAGAEETVTKETVLAVGDIITSVEGAKAEVSYPDGSSLLIKDNTQVTVKAADGRKYIRADGTEGIAVDWLNLDMKQGTMFTALASRHEGTNAANSSLEKTSYELPPVMASLASTNSNGILGSLAATTAPSASQQQWYQVAQTKKVRVQVDMPWGVAAVRGTFVLISVDSSGRSKVSCLTGTAEVTAGGITIPLKDNTATQLTEQQKAPETTTTIPTPDIQQFAQETKWFENTAATIDERREVNQQISVPVDTPVNSSTPPPSSSPPSATLQAVQRALNNVGVSTGSTSQPTTTQPSRSTGGGGSSVAPVGSTVSITKPQMIFTGGITVDLGSTTVPQGAQVAVTQVPSASISQYLGTTGLTTAGPVLEISFTNYTITQPVTIKLPLTQGVQADKAGIFHYNTQSGNWEYVATRIENGYAVATVTHFSIYGVLLDQTAPANPAVAVKSINAGTVELELSAVDSSGIARYELYRDGSKIATVENASSYSDPGLTVNKSYSYTVKAIDMMGNTSAESSPITAAVGATNADLAAISVSPGELSPSFAAATVQYQVTVTNPAAAITISAQTMDANATYKLYSDAACTAEITNQPLTLTGSEISVYIKVTAQDGKTTKLYTVKIQIPLPNIKAEAGERTAISIKFGTELSPSTLAINNQNQLISSAVVMSAEGNSQAIEFSTADGYYWYQEGTSTKLVIPIPYCCLFNPGDTVKINLSDNVRMVWGNEERPFPVSEITTVVKEDTTAPIAAIVNAVAGKRDWIGLQFSEELLSIPYYSPLSLTSAVSVFIGESTTPVTLFPERIHWQLADPTSPIVLLPITPTDLTIGTPIRVVFNNDYLCDVVNNRIAALTEVAAMVTEDNLPPGIETVATQNPDGSIMLEYSELVNCAPEGSGSLFDSSALNLNNYSVQRADNNSPVDVLAITVNTTQTGHTVVNLTFDEADLADLTDNKIIIQVSDVSDGRGLTLLPQWSTAVVNLGTATVEADEENGLVRITNAKNHSWNKLNGQEVNVVIISGDVGVQTTAYFTDGCADIEMPAVFNLPVYYNMTLAIEGIRKHFKFNYDHTGGWQQDYNCTQPGLVKVATGVNNQTIVGNLMVIDKTNLVEVKYNENSSWQTMGAPIAEVSNPRLSGGGGLYLAYQNSQGVINIAQCGDGWDQAGGSPLNAPLGTDYCLEAGHEGAWIAYRQSNGSLMTYVYSGSMEWGTWNNRTGNNPPKVNKGLSMQPFVASVSNSVYECPMVAYNHYNQSQNQHQVQVQYNLNGYWHQVGNPININADTTSLVIHKNIPLVACTAGDNITVWINKGQPEWLLLGEFTGTKAQLNVSASDTPYLSFISSDGTASLVKYAFQGIDNGIPVYAWIGGRVHQPATDQNEDNISVYTDPNYIYDRADVISMAYNNPEGLYTGFFSDPLDLIYFDESYGVLDFCGITDYYPNLLNEGEGFRYSLNGQDFFEVTGDENWQEEDVILWLDREQIDPKLGVIVMGPDGRKIRIIPTYPADYLNDITVSQGTDFNTCRIEGLEEVETSEEIGDITWYISQPQTAPFPVPRYNVPIADLNLTEYVSPNITINPSQHFLLVGAVGGKVKRYADISVGAGQIVLTKNKAYYDATPGNETLILTGINYAEGSTQLDLRKFTISKPNVTPYALKNEYTSYNDYLSYDTEGRTLAVYLTEEDAAGLAALGSDQLTLTAAAGWNSEDPNLALDQPLYTMVVSGDSYARLVTNSDGTVLLMMFLRDSVEGGPLVADNPADFSIKIDGTTVRCDQLPFSQFKRNEINNAIYCMPGPGKHRFSELTYKGQAIPFRMDPDVDYFGDFVEIMTIGGAAVTGSVFQVGEGRAAVAVFDEDYTLVSGAYTDSAGNYSAPVPASYSPRNFIIRALKQDMASLPPYQLVNEITAGEISSGIDFNMMGDMALPTAIGAVMTGPEETTLVANKPISYESWFVIGEWFDGATITPSPVGDTAILNRSDLIGQTIPGQKIMDWAGHKAGVSEDDVITIGSLAPRTELDADLIPGTGVGTIRIATEELPTVDGAAQWWFKIGKGAFVPPVLDASIWGAVQCSEEDITVNPGDHVLLLVTDNSGKVKAYDDRTVMPSAIRRLADITAAYIPSDRTREESRITIGTIDGQSSPGVYALKALPIVLANEAAQAPAAGMVHVNVTIDGTGSGIDVPISAGETPAQIAAKISQALSDGELLQGKYIAGSSGYMLMFMATQTPEPDSLISINADGQTGITNFTAEGQGENYVGLVSVRLEAASQTDAEVFDFPIQESSTSDIANQVASFLGDYSQFAADFEFSCDANQLIMTARVPGPNQITEFSMADQGAVVVSGGYVSAHTSDGSSAHLMLEITSASRGNGILKLVLDQRKPSGEFDDQELLGIPTVRGITLAAGEDKLSIANKIQEAFANMVNGSVTVIPGENPEQNPIVAFTLPDYPFVDFNHELVANMPDPDLPTFSCTVGASMVNSEIPLSIDITSSSPGTLYYWVSEDPMLIPSYEEIKYGVGGDFMGWVNAPDGDIEETIDITAIESEYCFVWLLYIDESGNAAPIIGKSLRLRWC